MSTRFGSRPSTLVLEHRLTRRDLELESGWQTSVMVQEGLIRLQKIYIILLNGIEGPPGTSQD